MTQMETDTRQREEYEAAYAAALRRVADTQFVGHAPYGHEATLTKPRRHSRAIEARHLRVGDTVRARYFDYDNGRDEAHPARVAAVDYTPGREEGYSGITWLLLHCPDGRARTAQHHSDREVETPDDD